MAKLAEAGDPSAPPQARAPAPHRPCRFRENHPVRRLVYYSLFNPPADPRPDLLRQLVSSIHSLREHNQAVSVVVFVYGDEPPELAPSLTGYGVGIRRQEGYRARLERLCPE